MTILSFACFSLYFHFILTVGFDYQVLALPTASSSEMRYLQMRAGAPFKIALFADLHFGENAWTEWGPQQDVNSIQVMNTVLDDETPGDFITSLLLFMSFFFFFFNHELASTSCNTFLKVGHVVHVPCHFYYLTK